MKILEVCCLVSTAPIFSNPGSLLSSLLSYKSVQKSHRSPIILHPPLPYSKCKPHLPPPSDPHHFPLHLHPFIPSYLRRARFASDILGRRCCADGRRLDAWRPLSLPESHCGELGFCVILSSTLCDSLRRLRVGLSLCNEREREYKNINIIWF